MEEPWTLVVVAVCACLMVCVLLFTIIRCCLCTYKGIKTYQNDSTRHAIPFDYRLNDVINEISTNVEFVSTVPVNQSMDNANIVAK